MARKLIVEIIGDSTKLVRSLNQSTVAANQFGMEVTGSAGRAEKSLTKLQRVAAGGFLGGVAAGAAINQLQAAVGVASNLNEQMARSNVVFGSAADSVVAWSETTAESMGIAQDEALAAAGTFGAMFDQAGQAAPKAARLSEVMVGLASDLASFNNASIEETLTAIRSGLSGEIEPLRRFQVFLTEAAVSQRAMADSGKTNVQQLTQGEKIMARYNLILEQTGKQQGDYARTSESLANTQRRLSAQVRDLQADIGNALLPAVAGIANTMSDAVAATKLLGDALEDLGSLKIPAINIPINFELPGTSVSVTDLGKEVAKQAGPFSFFFRAQQLLDLLIPDPDTASVNVDAAKRWDEVFAPFTNAAVEEGGKAAQRAGAKVAAAFGQTGFKPLEENDLGERLQRQFDLLVESLELRVDQASAAGNKDRELRVLGEIEAAIRQRMAVHGRTTDLLRQLFQVQQQRKAVLDGIAAQQREAQQARVDAVLEGLGIKVDRAKLTRSLADDLRALDDLAAGLRAQIRKGGDVSRFQSQLVGVTGEIADIQEQIRQNAADALQARQFKALGLGRAGEEIIPGAENLRKQLSQLSDRLADTGTELGSKLGNQLDGARQLLSGKFGKLTEDTRERIRDLFRTIRGEFEDGAKQSLTKTQSLRSNRLLEGLGLDRDMERQLRARLSRFNTGGQALAANLPAATVGVGVRPNAIVVENHNTIALDGDVVARNVTRSQQKRRRRNPPQKRGPNSGV